MQPADGLVTRIHDSFHSSRLLAWKPNPRTTQVVRDPSCLLYQSAGHDAQDRTAQAGREGHLKAARLSAAFVACPVCNPQPPAPVESFLHFWLLVSAQKLPKYHLGSAGLAGTISRLVSGPKCYFWSEATGWLLLKSTRSA